MKRGRRRRSWFLVAVGLIALLVGMARGITSPLAGGPVPVGEGLVGAGVFFCFGEWTVYWPFVAGP